MAAGSASARRMIHASRFHRSSKSLQLDVRKWDGAEPVYPAFAATLSFTHNVVGHDIGRTQDVA